MGYIVGLQEDAQLYVLVQFSLYALQLFYDSFVMLHYFMFEIKRYLLNFLFVKNFHIFHQ